MNIDLLLSDTAFKLLEKEYVKRVRKAKEGGIGQAEYKLYLEAMVKRIQELLRGAEKNLVGRTETKNTSIEKEKLKPSEVIQPNGNPEVIENMKFIKKTCEDRHDSGSFTIFLPEDFVGVSDLQIWLKDMGLPWEVAAMDSPGGLKGIENVSNIVGNKDGKAEEGYKGDQWKVTFRRV